MAENQREVINDLLGILQHYAPTGKEQQECSEILWEMQRDGMEPDKIIMSMSNMIGDGLKHGNWPWIKANKK